MALTNNDMNLLAGLLAKADSEERRQLAGLLIMKEVTAHGVPWISHTIDNPDGRPIGTFIGSTHPDVIAKIEAFADQLGPAVKPPPRRPPSAN